MLTSLSTLLTAAGILVWLSLREVCLRRLGVLDDLEALLHSELLQLWAD